MSDPAGRVNDAFQAARSLQTLQREKTSLTKTISAAEHVLDDIRANNELDPTLLDYLVLGSSRGYALRMKLRGLLSVKRIQLQKVRSTMIQDIEILKKISVCPYCGGSGEKLSHSYERFERGIHATISSDKCEHCDGTGKIQLGKQVEKIVEETLKQVSKVSDGHPL